MPELSRRAVLSTGSRAAVATLALGGVSVAAGNDAHDPIYAAIRAHWETELALESACRGEPCSDDPNAHSPEWEAAEAAWRISQEAAGKAVFNAQWAMLDIEPTTVAGVLAFLDYVTEFPSNGIRGWMHRNSGEGCKPNGYISFEDDAMRFVSRSIKRLLSVPT